jgi:hypothetical protein
MFCYCCKQYAFVAHRRGKLTFLHSSHSQLPLTPGSGLWPPPMAVAFTAAGSPNSWQSFVYFISQNEHNELNDFSSTSQSSSQLISN